MSKPTAETVRRWLRYDEETGLFYWIAGQLAGEVAGARHMRWVRIKLQGRSYYAHQLAWLLIHGAWPDGPLDHIDNDGTNNRPANLRRCTHAENTRNRKRRADNRLGIKGVYRQRSGRYSATITCDGEATYLGMFDTAEEAHSAYCAAAARLHGEFARAA